MVEKGYVSDGTDDPLTITRDMIDILPQRSMVVLILGLSFLWQVGCTKTADSIETHSPATATDGTTLEPGAPNGAPGSVAPAGSCNIEMLNGMVATERPFVLPANGALRLVGWVVDESHRQTAPEELFIVLQHVASGSQWNAKVSSRFSRPDVASAMGSSLMSGFTTGFDISNLPQGEYRLVVAYWQDGPLKLCDIGRRVLIE